LFLRSLGHPEQEGCRQVETKTKPAALVAFARKAAALKVSAAQPTLPPALAAANSQHQAKAAIAPDHAHEQHDREVSHGPHGPPPAERLVSKHEVLAITGVSHPTIWSWMRAGKFPRSRIVGGKSMWLSTDIAHWLEQLPIRPLKGDPVAVETPVSAGVDRLALGRKRAKVTASPARQDRHGDSTEGDQTERGAP
jgi:predicted DNA-binding transcriptional regulator AlpA